MGILLTAVGLFYFLFFVYVLVAVSGVWLLFWMTEHGIWRWDQLFSYSERKRALNEALANGAVRCSCHLGRVIKAYRCKNPDPVPYHFVSERCQKCFGAGVLLPEVKPQASLR